MLGVVWEWIQWYGVPERVVCDDHGSFKAEFSDNLERKGIRQWVISADSFWQNVKTEVECGQWKRSFNRLYDEVKPRDEDEYLECVCCINVARGQVIRQGGWSPGQLIFGRNARLPGSLLNPDPEKDLGILSRIETGDEVLKRAM